MKTRCIGFVFLIVLLSGCGGAAVPSATPTSAIPTHTPVPTSTSTPPPRAAEAALDGTPETTAEGTFDPALIPTQIIVTVEPVTGQRIPPPLEIDLPEGWAFGYDGVMLQDLDGIRIYQVAVYQGPVTGGTGSIVVVWGFAPIMVGNPLAGAGQVNLWSDGLRLWRLLITEIGCVVGTDLQRDYVVGGLPAVGTQVSVVDCPEYPDAAGWFGGLNVDDLNFLFYAFTDTQSILGPAADELQAILDTVVFRVQEYRNATRTPLP